MAYSFPTYDQLIRSHLSNPRNIGYGNLTPRLQGAITSPLAALPSPTPAGGPSAGPPAGYGDLINQLLSGLAGAQGGMTPEEGLASARRALIQYGGVPQGLSGLHNLAGAFDHGTSALANANTTSGVSVLARLGQAHTDQNRFIKNRLAAHGILSSGETGFQTGREQTNYVRAQADSASKLLDYLSGINSGITQYLQWQAMMDALRNAMAGGYGGGGDGTVTGGAGGNPITTTSTGYGSYQTGPHGSTYKPFLAIPRGRRNVYY